MTSLRTATCIAAALFSFLLSTVIVLETHAEPSDSSTKGFTVEGRVIIKVEDKEISGTPTIVVLQPLDSPNSPTLRDKLNRPSKEHRVLMRGKRFSPRYMAVQLGDSVSFVNGDDFDHNVFSPSQQDEFDLGSYPFQAKRSHTFSKVGLSKVYCNVHSTMAFFALVYQSGFGTIAETNEQFRFENVPVGAYTLKAWNLRGEVEKQIAVRGAGDLSETLTISGSSTVDLNHPNKFGEEYSEAASDEIY